MKKYKKVLPFIIILFLMICNIFVINNVFSACSSDMATNDNGNPCISNPLGTTVSVNELIGQIINAILGIVGSLALAMFIYGGITWMTAAGSQERVKKGKDILIWATLGLVVIFTSYAMVAFVLDKVVGGT